MRIGNRLLGAGHFRRVLGGKATFKNGEHTGALTGKLLRSTAGGIQ